MNTRLIDNQSLIAGVPESHPCSIRTANIAQNNIEEDYQDLSNCCQRHVCRLEGYCKSTFVETENTVRANIL